MLQSSCIVALATGAATKSAATTAAATTAAATTSQQVLPPGIESVDRTNIDNTTGLQTLLCQGPDAC